MDQPKTTTSAPSAVSESRGEQRKAVIMPTFLKENVTRKTENNSRFYKPLAMEMLIWMKLFFFSLQMATLIIEAKEKSSARRAIL